MSNININILETPLSLDDCYNLVVNEACGGIAIFVGTVRNQNKGETVVKLDFESYVPMAIKEMTNIANECYEKFEAKHVVIHHRVGEVGLTEKAVIIAVSTKHRAHAFNACQYAIDQLKDRVPIWKKEFLEDGSYWVNARP